MASDSQQTNSDKTPRRASYQDVLDAPPHMVAEVVDGVLYLQPRPAPPHALAYASLGMIIGSPFQFGRGGPGGWWILSEPELHFGKDIVVPDIAGWRRERMPVFPEEAYFTLVPDWVCEILSKSTRKLDLGGKRAIYAREGVRYQWFVDPIERSLEAYELRDEKWVLIDKLYEDAQVSLPPFDAISFNLGDLWIPATATHTVHKAVPSPTGIEFESASAEADR